MFEQIVRPFVSPETISDKRSVVTTVIRSKPQRAVLAWGAVGQAPTVSSVVTKIKDNDKKWRELSRVTRDVRVENPDDPSQFVVERRVKKMEVKETSTIQTPSGGGTGTGNNSGQSAGAQTNTAYQKDPLVDITPAVKTVDVSDESSAGNPTNKSTNVTIQLLDPTP